MNIPHDSGPQQVEIVKYNSPWRLPGMAALFVILISSAVICGILVKFSSIGKEALIDILLFIGGIFSFGSFLFTLVQEVETGEDGLRMKCFPRRYRFFPWTDIQKLVRGRDVIIYRKGPVDFWPAYIPASYSSQLEMIYSGPDEITKLVAIICQQARLSPKRKSLWRYDVSVRDDR